MDPKQLQFMRRCLFVRWLIQRGKLSDYPDGSQPSHDYLVISPSLRAGDRPTVAADPWVMPPIPSD